MNLKLLLFLLYTLVMSALSSCSHCLSEYQDLQIKFRLEQIEAGNSDLGFSAKIEIFCDKHFGPSFLDHIMLILGPIILFLIGVIVMIVMRYRLKKKIDDYEAKHIEASKMKLMNEKRQFEPDFFFNALNKIQVFMMNKDVENGSSFVQKVSDFIKTTEQFHMEEMLPLEIELVYLKQLQLVYKERFKDRYEIEFIVEDEATIKQTMVPTYTINRFIDNAIHHAFEDLPKPDNNITVKIELIKDATKHHHVTLVEVKDTGVGYDFSKRKMSQNPYPGLTLIKNLVDLRNKEMKMDLSRLEIVTGPSKEDRRCGTSVRLYFPFRKDFVFTPTKK